MARNRYNPDQPANDVAHEDEGCSYCGEDIPAGTPVVRATVTFPGRERANCRHAYKCS